MFGSLGDRGTSKRLRMSNQRGGGQAVECGALQSCIGHM